ncbi:MAG TPA: hypothetical protein EYO88_10915 [Alphaproteobacteria bacterium]|jgi:hypothetical protein|nr:hypothetical protein [Alphaproteobacteria bacterium]
MKKILKKGKRGNRKERLVAYEEMLNLDGNSTRIELIQMLIPLGLQAVEEELQSEVMKIAGVRYTPTHLDFKRWCQGRNKSVPVWRSKSVPLTLSFPSCPIFRRKAEGCIP